MVHLVISILDTLKNYFVCCYRKISVGKIQSSIGSTANPNSNSAYDFKISQWPQIGNSGEVWCASYCSVWVIQRIFKGCRNGKNTPSGHRIHIFDIVSLLSITTDTKLLLSVPHTIMHTKAEQVTRFLFSFREVTPPVANFELNAFRPRKSGMSVE